MLSRLRTRGVAVVPSISFSKRALSDAFSFKGVSTSDISEATFRISDGSKVALMGSNEAAKSNIMNLLNGQGSVTSGAISLPQGQNVTLFKPAVPKEAHILTVKKYLEGCLSANDSKDSGAAIEKALENVKLGARIGRRTINTLNGAQHARLQLAAALLRSPDVLLLDQPTVTSSGPLSHDDVQDLVDFLSHFPKTCVVNSNDEDFLDSFIDTVLYVDQAGAVEKFASSYASAKKVIDLRKRAEESISVEKKYRSKPANETGKSYADFAEAEAELDALNQVGFKNSKVSDEEYIRLMMIFMALHPPLIYLLHRAGAFDAIL